MTRCMKTLIALTTAAISGRVAPVLAAVPPVGSSPAPQARGEYELIAQNDLGMHCMNEDFSELVILPPYNTVRAQVIQRRREPNVVTEGLTLRYAFPSNARSADKTNFWKYCPQIFGVALPPNVGLTGHGMTGTLDALPRDGVWEVSGIPITPFDDRGRLQPYPLVTIIAEKDGVEVARTQTVVPVSQEITCNLCHVTPGISTSTDILRDHDRLHGTSLEQSKPVLCAACHADPALGAEGNPELPMLSHAMHAAHADRMDQSGLDNVCYACHPGIRTQCQRDVHMAGQVECVDCHGGMAQVGDSSRMPWLEEPTCGSCHARTGFEFEEPGKLFRFSRGHGGVACLTCHGSPHAITPTLTAVDNVQSMRLQGRPGTINDCLVCHTRQPEDNFRHRLFN
ncbi:MAG: hypothetical protein KJ057_06380 [Phycisphaerae bacterium]|nr:MAG: hypothetical protein F9K17_09230 [Phycisphaerae bacterium]MBE7458172.1 hypothetical protein [Planctomycetia bacterium]MCK6464363.1 hypothetical protein [Phycisphaerae bacterium]MCL4718086.1 hypothetical protein [Phycisphaerae bacterium]NUQ10322.1 hypothetical protein [Phycisphaerae bacterium]